MGTWVTIAFHTIVDILETMVNLAGVSVTLQQRATATVQFFVTMDTIIMAVGWAILATNHGIIAQQFAMKTAPQTCNIATMDTMTMDAIWEITVLQNAWILLQCNFAW